MFIFSFYGFLVGLDNFFKKLLDFLDPKNSRVLSTFITYTYFVTLTIVLINGGWKIQQTTHQEYWANTGKYPYLATQYIRENPPKGNMLNAYNWGGYLIWQLPEYKTFIDGRMTSWREDGKYFMLDYYNIHKTDALNSYVERYNIGWVLDYTDSPLAKTLALNSEEWELLYEDETSVIYTKITK